MRQQLSLAAKKGSILLSCIRNDVACRSVEVILALYSALIRPHLEHWLPFRVPQYRRNIHQSPGKGP